MRIANTFISHQTRLARRGVSVIEVLFAMGVAVIGLLGIASLIPMSAKNASDSLQMSEAAALSNDWYSEFTARGLHVSGNWIMFRDFGPPTATIGFNKQLGATLPARGCTPASPLMLRELGRESICLDPYFLAQTDVQNLATGTLNAGQSNWYRPAVFPYYQDTYNPLVDSAYTQAATSSLAWDAQPRMVRVTLPSTAGALVPMSIRSLEQTFLSTDDLAITLDVPALNIDDKDETIPPMRIGQLNSRFASTNHYSWFATMSPAEPIPALSTDSTNFYTVSLAVVHNRDLRIFDPAMTIARTGANDPPRVDEKPQGERLMMVEPLSGNFIGGNGGRVRLISSDGTDDDIKSGDWVMLGRTYAGSTPSPTFRPFTVFRWYRIISVEQRAASTLLPPPIGPPPPLPLQLGNLTQVTQSAMGSDPFGHTAASIPNQVWGREVVLEGPDWVFTGGVAGTVATPTTATMVKGVRTVIERVITIY